MTDPTQVSGDNAALESKAAPSGWERIKEHKVLQWGLAYIGAALAIAHGQELMATAYGWPHSVGRLVMTLLVLGLPLALTLAWYHGHRGLKGIGKGEMAILSVLILIGAGVLTLFVRVPDHAATPTATLSVPSASPTVALPVTAPARLRLAILPFENLSPDPANAFFTDGLHEEITSAMANRGRGGLEVISRTTMMTYRMAPKPVLEIARELGATHVLEGSVRREGQDVRLTLQLIDAKKDEHVWSQNFDRKLVKAMTLQSEVANEVAAQLSVQLAGGSQAARGPTQDPEAYDLYLKALYLRSGPDRFAAENSIAKIEDLLTQAIARDPQFGLAYLERASVRLDLTQTDTFFLSNLSSPAVKRAAADLDAAQRLLGDDPAVVVGRASFYLYQDGNDPTRALQTVEAAETAGLNDPKLQRLKAILLANLDRVSDALPILERLIALDPGNRSLLQNYAVCLQAARRPADALRVLTLLREQFKDPVAPFQRARILVDYTGRIDPLRDTLDRHGKDLTASTRLGYTAEVLTLEQRYGELERILEASPLRVVPFRIASGNDAQMPMPVARASVYLLMNNKSELAKQGIELLKLSPPTGANTSTTDYNRFLKLLNDAQSQLYSGDRDRAIATTHDLLNLASQMKLVLFRRFAPAVAARILAWAGETEEAAGLLEDLSTGDWGLTPAQITRDPLYSVPLANNARYKALCAKLEARMAATKLE